MRRTRHAVVAGAVITGLMSALAVTAEADQTTPAPAPLVATLSPQVAAVPGIASYLQSSQPKSVEWINGHTVWVGTGNPTDSGDGTDYAASGDTLAGTYQDVQGSNNTPASWPTESVAAASSSSRQTVSPDVIQQSPCMNQDFCLETVTPYATYGYYETGATFLDIGHRYGFLTNKWYGYVQTPDGTTPTEPPHTSVSFSGPMTVTFLDITGS